jgi:dGTPase
VDVLEARYPDFDGLNLTFETREGILKHCSLHNAQRLVQAEPDGPAVRFLDGSQPSLEAQLVNLADEMAYNTHDIDDGVRSGLIGVEQLEGVHLFARLLTEARAAYPALAGRRLLFDVIRRMLALMVDDLVASTRAAIDAHSPADADAVRRLPAMAQFSPALRAEIQALKQFLFRELYRHPQVTSNTDLARRVVAELYAAYTQRPQEMPADFGADAEHERAVADYIAGMTDRFALREHQRLTGVRLFD